MTVTIPAEEKARLLEDLARSFETNMVQACKDALCDYYGLMERELQELITKHGYPRPDSMRKAAAILRGQKMTQTTTLPTPAPVAAPAAHPILKLLHDGRTSTLKPIRTLAAKIEADLERLTDMVEADRENAKARAEVERLEQQLAAAKAKLKGGPKPAAGPPPSVVREWAKANGVPCPERGRVPAEVVEAYKKSA